MNGLGCGSVTELVWHIGEACPVYNPYSWRGRGVPLYSFLPLHILPHFYFHGICFLFFVCFCALMSLIMITCREMGFILFGYFLFLCFVLSQSLM